MRKQGLALVTLLLALGAYPSAKSGPSQAIVAFKKLRSLAGDWEGKDEKGQSAKTSFRVLAGETAVMETLEPPGMESMVTLYSVDKDAIAMIHYCPTNNQPHMRAVPAAGELKELVFDFLGAGNLATPETGHQHKLVLRFDHGDQITEFWTWRQNGKDTPMVLQFTRKRS